MIFDKSVEECRQLHPERRLSFLNKAFLETVIIRRLQER